MQQSFKAKLLSCILWICQIVVLINGGILAENIALKSGRKIQQLQEINKANQ